VGILEHPKNQNKPCPLGHGETQGFFDINENFNTKIALTTLEY